MSSTKTIWHPTQPWCRETNVRRFMAKHGIKDYQTLLQRSVADIRWFWDAALTDLGMEWSTPYTDVLDDTDGMPWARWFVGGELNIVQNCIDRHAASARGSQAALIWEGDGGQRTSITYRALAERVSQCAAHLHGLGVGIGDTVGLFLPLEPDVVVAMFACQKIGAVPIPIFSGYGPEALATRLADAKAKVVITCEQGARRGKAVPIRQVVDAALAHAPSVEHVVIASEYTLGSVPNVNYNAGASHSARNETMGTVPIVSYETIRTVPTVPLPSEAPALILYTSGTTGKPKGCVHTHAGCLAQMAKELGYHFDVKPGERFFWFTDIGWMMGPWELIGALFHGATVVLYSGVPNWPQPDRVWRIIERTRATHLGISPTAIRVLKSAGDTWVDHCDLSSLRILGSTGEPWDPEGYQWYFEKVGGGRCPVVNISGGTEIVGCHLAPLPIHPIKSCSLQGPGLGMDVDVFNEDGQSVREEIGYLVCKQPAPSMTKGFLGDNARYLETYFSKWPAVWNHGDWAIVDAEGHWFLQGRSDDTIKVAGKRVGPAEIEGALMEHPAVSEAAAIGVPHAIKGEVIVCFVVLTDDWKPVASDQSPVKTENQRPATNDGLTDDRKLTTDDALVVELLSLVASKLGKPMRPEAIHFVPALPKTRSAKIVRGAIKRVWLGEDPGDVSSIENPQALDAIIAQRDA